jgi:response regulator RpfG family c-di-GMP phosphodiesterase
MNEKRLVDANALIRHLANLERENEDTLFTYEEVKRFIRNAPTDTTNLDAKLDVLQPSKNDIIVAEVDMEQFTAYEIQNIAKVIEERFRDIPVIFTTKDITFTVKDKNEFISELQKIIDKMRSDVSDE